MPSRGPGAEAPRSRRESTEVAHFISRNPERRWVALGEGISTGANWESIAELLLKSSEERIRSQLREIQNPELIVNLGFREDSNLLAGHRLHLYAVAFADRIKECCGVQLSRVRLSKQRGDSTTVAVDEVIQAERPSGAPIVTMMTRRSYATPAFGDEVRKNANSLGKVLVPNIPLRLHVSYLTGLPRTWHRLWQPTISGVFADQSQGEREGSAQIVNLGFDHQSIGEELGHRVQLTISASRISIAGQRSRMQ
jgi:hypothetical protein